MQICSFVLQNARSHGSVQQVQINREPESVHMFQINGSTLYIYFCILLLSLKKLRKRGMFADILPCPKKKIIFFVGYMLVQCEFDLAVMSSQRPPPAGIELKRYTDGKQAHKKDVQHRQPLGKYKLKIQWIIIRGLSQ